MFHFIPPGKGPRVRLLCTARPGTFRPCTTHSSIALRAAASFAAAFFYPAVFALLFSTVACASSPVTGRVVDTVGRPIVKALVVIDGQSVHTNHQGFFHFPAVAPDRYSIRVEHARFATTFKDATVYAENTSSLRIVMAPGKQVRIKSFRRPNRIRTRDLDLKIPGDALVDEDGKLAKAGSLHFSVLNVRGRGLQAMPGRFVGRGTDGKLVDLESVGAASLVFKSGTKKLQVKPGKKLTMLLPYQGKLRRGQTTVPMWYLDEKAGIWKREGTGHIVRRKGKLWVRAQLPHLSWWNCDQPWYNKTTILVRRVEFADGQKANGARVQALGLDYNGSTYTKPPRDTEGYCMEVKPNSRVRLSILHYGLNQVYTHERILRTQAGPSSCARNPEDGIVIDKIIFKKPKTRWACIRGRVDSELLDSPHVRIQGVEVSLLSKFGNKHHRRIRVDIDDEGKFCLDHVPAGIRVSSDPYHIVTPSATGFTSAVPVPNNKLVVKTRAASCRVNPDACQDTGIVGLKISHFEPDDPRLACTYRPRGCSAQFMDGSFKDMETIVYKGGGQVRGCVLGQNGDTLVICSREKGTVFVHKSKIRQQLFK